ncbi:MAG: DNA polymerase I [Chloroflexi bacterium]|nr:DNA polymerase I [Chloroflexota bacterium]
MTQPAFSDNERPLLLVVDGHAMVYRAFFSIPERLSTGTGQDTRGAYGFLTTFLKVVRDHRPTHAAVAFDTSAPTFRDDRYPEYKAGRPPMPDELRQQFPLVKQILDSFKIPYYEKDGWEADDLIGTMSRVATEAGMDTLVVTGDRDELQLVSDTVNVLMYSGFGNTKVYGIDEFRERYAGLMPDSLPDVKALQGDPSDNIPGVPGVGEKAAFAVLKGRDRLEKVYEELDEIEAMPTTELRGAKRVRRLLEENREVAFEGRWLTTISQEAPMDLELEDMRFWKYDREEVAETLLGLEFRTVLRQVPDPATLGQEGGDSTPTLSTPQNGEQLGLGFGGATSSSNGGTPPPSIGDSVKVDYSVVTTSEDLDSLMKELSTTEGFAFDTETSGVNPMEADLVGVSFANTEGKAWYVPLGHFPPPELDEDGNEVVAQEQIPMAQALDAMRTLFADPAIPKAAHNANFDVMVMNHAGLEVNGVDFDTMIAAALTGRRQIGLKQLALEFFQVEMTPITALIGTGRKQITMAEGPVEKAAPYAAADADFTWRLRRDLNPRLDTEETRAVFDDIEMPLLPAIVRMQQEGVMVDTEQLERFSVELGTELDRLKADTANLLGGTEINMNSSQQLAAVLFDEYDVPKTRRTKTGYSMDAATLEGLLEKEDLNPNAFELIKNVLSFRELGKLKSTYVDSLPKLVVQSTGRVHTSFNQVGSATGRLSSSDPNVQNIPVRTELGKRVRQAFKADGENGWTLLAADYSQIELRILAHLSQEPGLLEAFRNGEDIHTATATAMYGEGSDDPDGQRRIAKILNFGVIYGLGPVGVARQTDLSRAQGAEFIEMYFSKYPGLKDYIEGVKESAREKGYVETITGRRRRLPDIRTGSQMARAASERMAVNMPIQGTSADIIKIAMINIDREIRDRDLKSRMIIQVHDELIFEVAPGELMEVQAMVSELMPSAMELSVPLEVEIKTGPTWGDME